MDFLKKTTAYFLDFLFPQPAAVSRLEHLSASELLSLLPPVQEVEDDRSLILFDYHDENVRTLIWELKYHGNKKLAQTCVVLLSDALTSELSERALSENFIDPLLIPLPISPQRRRERGYNQTELLAEALVKITGETFFKYNPKILQKVHHTDSQARTHATKRERTENLKGSMGISPTHTEKVKKRNIILLDDVTTSGATFAEAKRVLKAAGARKILCVALAH